MVTGLIAIFTGDFFENTLANSLDESYDGALLVVPFRSTLLNSCLILCNFPSRVFCFPPFVLADSRPVEAISVTISAAILAFVVMGLFNTQRVALALVVSIMLFALLLGATIFVLLLDDSESGYGAESKTLGITSSVLVRLRRPKIQ